MPIRSVRLLSTILVVAVAAPTTRAFAAEPAAAAASPTPIQASAARAAQTFSLVPSTDPGPQTAIPRTLPRGGRRFNQGAGAGMMVVSLISTAAGLAGTYYVVKMVRDQNKDTTQTAGFR